MWANRSANTSAITSRGKVTSRNCPDLITNGNAVASNPEGGYFVPKKELVSSQQIAIETARLRNAPSLLDADLLVKVLHNFRTKV